MTTLALRFYQEKCRRELDVRKESRRRRTFNDECTFCGCGCGKKFHPLIGEIPAFEPEEEEEQPRDYYDDSKYEEDLFNERFEFHLQRQAAKDDEDDKDQKLDYYKNGAFEEDLEELGIDENDDDDESDEEEEGSEDFADEQEADSHICAVGCSCEDCEQIISDVDEEFDN